MMISQLTAGQAMDMGIVEAAIRQATTEQCNCEAETHFLFMGERGHAYLAVPAGKKWAQFVGRVCDHCAETCMADYLI